MLDSHYNTIALLLNKDSKLNGYIELFVTINI